MKIEINNTTTFDYITDNCLDNLGSLSYIQSFKGKKAFLLTDNNVEHLYADKVIHQLTVCDINVYNHTVTAGEGAKSIDNYLSIINLLADNHFTRHDLIINLGGGTISDLGGFCASTYQRGITYINLPTTLLSIIDASMGGKTAINLPQGKNLLGTFAQPKLILADLSTLSTLPNIEWLNGLGELLKYCLLIGKPLNDLMSNWQDNLASIITMCAQYKLNLVVKDIQDNNSRKLLNLGHTVAHAIEKSSNYTITHGIAVAQGALLTLKYALRTSKVSIQEYDTFIELYNSLNMPTLSTINTDTIIKNCTNDKKATANGLDIVLLNGIGDCYIANVSWQQFASMLDIATQ